MFNNEKQTITLPGRVSTVPENHNVSPAITENKWRLKTIMLLLLGAGLLFGMGAIISLKAKTFFSNFAEPLDLPVNLSANFGEIRPDHWHMGLDIRTNGKENHVVRSVAAGYVSRIVIGAEGYGRAIYITHTNNRTSLYAHLNCFYDELEKYVNDITLKTESWEQDIKLKPGKFPVARGMEIGLSGNTGHSEGPHLHFEWRNTITGTSINPQLELMGTTDKEAPAIESLYWYNRLQSTAQQRPRGIEIAKGQPEGKLIEVSSPLISLGISAIDKISKSPFNMGIYRAKIMLDDSLIFRFSTDSISETDNKNINGCIDYANWYRKGEIIQHLSQLKGNNYSKGMASGSGIIWLGDKKSHIIKLELQDIAGNISRLAFIFRYVPVKPEKQQNLHGSDKQILPNIKTGAAFSLLRDDLRVFFPKNAFYEDIFFQLTARKTNDRNLASDIIGLHDGSIPLKDSIRLMIRASRELSDFQQKHTVLIIKNNRMTKVIRGSWKNDWFDAKLNLLGDAFLRIDTVPPGIKLSGWKNRQKFLPGDQLKIIVDDNLKEVQSFRAEINDRWVPFSRKSNSFVFRFNINNIKKGSNKLLIRTTDMAGNLTSNIFRFEN